MARPEYVTKSTDSGPSAERVNAEPTTTERGLPGRLLIPAIVAVAVSVAGFALTVWVFRQTLWVMIDADVYRWGGLMARDRRPVYDLKYAHFLQFTYPPFAIGVFVMVSRLTLSTLRWATTIATLLALGLSAWLGWGIAGYRRSTGRIAAALLIMSVALWLEPVQQTLSFGQVNVYLMLIVLLDLSQPDRRRWKGIGIGLATGFKLVPAIFIAYLLVTRRFRAATCAIVTFGATIAAGFLVLPRESRRYWLDGLFFDGGRAGNGTYVGNQSLAGTLSRALTMTTADVRPYWLIAAVIIAGCGLTIAAVAHRRGEELLAISATALTGLLVSPISWSHHWVWIVVVVVAVLDLGIRQSRSAGTLTAAALVAPFAVWPTTMPGRPFMPEGLIWSVPFDNDHEYHWHGLQLLTGNLYVIVAIGLLAALAGYLTRTRTKPA